MNAISNLPPRGGWRENPYWTDEDRALRDTREFRQSVILAVIVFIILIALYAIFGRADESIGLATIAAALPACCPRCGRSFAPPNDRRIAVQLTDSGTGKPIGRWEICQPCAMETGLLSQSTAEPDADQSRDPAAPRREFRYLTVGERRAIYHQARQGKNGLRNLALVYLLKASGLRISELLSLRVSDVWDGIQLRNRPMLPLAHAKTKKHRREIYWYDRHNLAQQALRDYLVDRHKKNGGLDPVEPLFEVRGRPMTRIYVLDLFRAIAIKAEIEPFSPHDFRVTCATDLERSTHDLGLVQKIMGHAERKNTERYIRIPAEESRIAAANLPL